MKHTICFILFAAAGVMAPVASHAAPPSTTPAPMQAQALRLLMGAGAEPLSAHPDCEPMAGDAATSRVRTLGDDLAATLFEMRDGPISVESRCEPASAHRAACQVVLTLARGELNWSRVYQFQASTPPGPRPALRALHCMVIP